MFPRLREFSLLPRNFSARWILVDFVRISQAEKGLSDWREAVNSGKFPLYLSDYLFSQEGAKSKYGFRFYDPDGLVCGSPAPVIKVPRTYF